MHYNKYIFATFMVGIVFFSGCTIKNDSPNSDVKNDLGQTELITIKGVANQTKDGYYIGEYVLEYNEIQKYDNDYASDKYQGKNIEIIGKEKEVRLECDPYAQCREGAYKVIYDIKSIKTVE